MLSVAGTVTLNSPTRQNKNYYNFLAKNEIRNIFWEKLMEFLLQNVNFEKKIKLLINKVGPIILILNSKN